jgi:hypothetical protein
MSAALLDRGKKVVLIYQIPEAGWDVPAYLTKEMMFGQQRDGNLSTSTAINGGTQCPFRHDARRHRRTPEPHSDQASGGVLQHHAMEGRCLLEINHQALYIDDDHVSQLGARMISARLDEL